MNILVHSMVCTQKQYWKSNAHVHHIITSSIIVTEMYQCVYSNLSLVEVKIALTEQKTVFIVEHCFCSYTAGCSNDEDYYMLQMNFVYSSKHNHPVTLVAVIKKFWCTGSVLIPYRGCTGYSVTANQVLLPEKLQFLKRSLQMISLKLNFNQTSISEMFNGGFAYKIHTK